ncbi:mitochondrial F1F0 ATP synthase subunit F Atp17 [Cordyceps militaris CM01]|uniref:Mitochondrial F1F0 ATP synthase subunit F Atp17 n=1 Tax=Cordyceps militaris (strain CM01) TaxID=983644 RepID=G3J3Y7_CORMM|nr:mitochondrial F1F0 ATP synthase subunit F Atp17 [Cordyceps militaris CM01]EGX95762.1 mitochondrial F1F0 ATP synthase subunit F Atp17 [Cordyceps militaris CM01]
MSFVTRRGLSTLIPPKVASPKAIGGAPDALRMQRVVSFYEKLPRGVAPEAKAKGLLGRYQARYFGKKASATRMDYLPQNLSFLREVLLSSTPLSSSSALVMPRTTTSTCVTTRTTLTKELIW